MGGLGTCVPRGDGVDGGSPLVALTALLDAHHQGTHALLDRLEPVAGKDLTLRPTKALFPWPLGLALLLEAAAATLPERQR